MKPEYIAKKINQIIQLAGYLLLTFILFFLFARFQKQSIIWYLIIDDIE